MRPKFRPSGKTVYDVDNYLAHICIQVLWLNVIVFLAEVEYLFCNWYDYGDDMGLGMYVHLA
jgi:hypothetical protein